MKIHKIHVASDMFDAIRTGKQTHYISYGVNSEPFLTGDVLQLIERDRSVHVKITYTEVVEIKIKPIGLKLFVLSIKIDLPLGGYSTQPN